MNIYFSRSYSDISIVDTSDLKVVNLQDTYVNTIIAPIDGVFTDFEGIKIKVKEGDILYIKNSQLCKSNKLDKLIKSINNAKQPKQEIDCGNCECEAKSIN
jgi:hypothetical protein